MENEILLIRRNNLKNFFITYVFATVEDTDLTECGFNANERCCIYIYIISIA